MMKNFFLIVLMIIGSLILPSNIFAMSVEEAYEAIPHVRTVFDVDSAQMLADEKECLNKVFLLTDRALVVRVQSLHWLQSNRQITLDNEKYDGILTELKSLSVPRRLQEFHQLIVSAIESQKLFFETWSGRNGFNGDLRGDQYVQSSSANLRQAYGILMSLYPNESNQNKQAFFDYLCALDFL